MKKGEIVLFLLVAFLASGCSKKEDAPKPNDPHVAGVWSGNGTDDAIGYYNIGIDLTQSNDSAAGTFTMAGSVATIKGNVIMDFGPVGTGNVRSLALDRKTWTVADPANANRVCIATMTLTPHTGQTNNTFMKFSYQVTDCAGGTWFGGANLTKMAGTN